MKTCKSYPAFSIPRVSGGEPHLCFTWHMSLPYSPRERGGTWYEVGRDMVRDVFPAGAGVNPRDRIQIIKKYGIPRVSGGEPSSTIAFLYIFSYSPRERG